MDRVDAVREGPMIGSGLLPHLNYETLLFRTGRYGMKVCVDIGWSVRFDDVLAWLRAHDIPVLDQR
jgi:hypothetical protein